MSHLKMHLLFFIIIATFKGEYNNVIMRTIQWRLGVFLPQHKNELAMEDKMKQQKMANVEREKMDARERQQRTEEKKRVDKQKKAKEELTR